MKVIEAIAHPVATFEANFTSQEHRQQRASYYRRVAQDVDGYADNVHPLLSFLKPGWRSNANGYRRAAEIVQRGL